MSISLTQGYHWYSPKLSSTSYWTMFPDHNLEAKSHNCKLAKSRENLRQGIFGTVSVWRDLTKATIVHSLCTEFNESLIFLGFVSMSNFHLDVPLFCSLG